MRHWITSFQWLHNAPLIQGPGASRKRVGARGHGVRFRPPERRALTGASPSSRMAPSSQPLEASVLIYLWIAVGSALGGMGRFWLSGVVAERIGETFPWGTIIV